MPCRPGLRPVAMVDHAGALFMFGTVSSTPSAPPSRSAERAGRRPSEASGPATDQVAPSQPMTRTRLIVDCSRPWLGRLAGGPLGTRHAAPPRLPADRQYPCCSALITSTFGSPLRPLTREAPPAKPNT